MTELLFRQRLLAGADALGDLTTVGQSASGHIGGTSPRDLPGTDENR
jgi:hypothetical protein